MIDKTRVFEVLCAKLRRDLDEAIQVQKASHEGATHEETRAEDPKDMRSTEASYLARGLAERAEALAEVLERLEAYRPEPFPETRAIEVGALVGVEDEDGVRGDYWLIPVAGGEKLDVDGTIVRTLTPTTPLGRELVGRQVGDEFEAALPRGRRELCITSVA